MIHFNLLPEEPIKSLRYTGYRRDLMLYIDDKVYFVISLCQFLNDPYRRGYDFEMGKRLIRNILRTQGLYVCFHGPCSNPFDFLDYIVKHDSTFKMEVVSVEYCSMSDFKASISGNLNEVSAAFKYSFFDEVTFQSWLSLAREIDPNMCSVG